MRRIYLFFLLCLIWTGAGAQRQTLSLDDHWIFTPGWNNTPEAGTRVDLPHTWNRDALYGRSDYYRGTGTYVRIIDAPRAWQGKRVYLRFGGANSVCDLSVNGHYIGQHRGGYTAFGWDITPHLRLGERNSISVRVSNAPDMTVAPLAGDFNIYGGLHRGVELIITPPVYISTGHYASGGLYITPTSVTARQASVNVNAVLSGAGGETVSTAFILHNPQGEAIDSVVRRITLDSRGSNRIAASFNIEAPELWSPERPALYNVEVRLGTDAGEDRVNRDFGLRWFGVDRTNRFHLNGAPYRIQGVCRVEDRAGAGNALRREHQRQDVALMKEMGVNAVRLAYHPHDPYFIELCDRAGILVWSEIPLTAADGIWGQGFNGSADFKANVREQTLEMIHQLYNHPSIVWWGLFDQLSQRGDDPAEFLRELNALIKETDGSRLTVAGSNQDGEVNFVTDLIGFNQFMGWNTGRPEGFESWTRDLRREFPNLRSGVSKYGAGASPWQHTDSLVRPDPAGYWHPERWQCHLHEQYWGVISAREAFWGSFAWTMFDYGDAAYRAGAEPGVADYGLVSFDRSLRKDAFYFYKANWNRDEIFLHICDQRWEERPPGRHTIRVYSNAPEVKLFVNGVLYDRRENDGLGRFLWRGIELHEGENVIEVLATESMTWERTTVTIGGREPVPPSRSNADSRTAAGRRNTVTGGRQ